MSNYIRHYQSGGCYFFTVVTHNRAPIFSNPENIQKLTAAFKVVKKSYPFIVDAMVILPDHLHCIWQLPDEDDDFSTRWRYIKTQFSKSIIKPVNDRGEKSIWQRRFWEHMITDEEDRRRHMDYIFYNPVKHGLVERVADWPYSSFLQAVSKGWYPMDWGSNVPQLTVGLDLE